MAADTFIVIDTIKGESGDETFKESIEVQSWSWGATQTAGFAVGTGGGVGKASLSDLNFTKFTDAATIPLGLALVKGSHIPKAVLSCRKAGDAPYVYLEITLNDLIVSSYQTGGQDGNGLPIENVSLAFSKFTMAYFSQDATGAVKAAGSYSWDIKANKAGK